MKPDWLAVPAAPDGCERGGRIDRVRVVLVGTSLSCGDGILHGLPAYADLEIERLDLGRNGRCGVVFDKHRLDVALSAGRHAVERASLAHCGLLIGVGQGGRKAGREQPVGILDDPYDALRRWGDGELAALVGMVIAGAQIGVPVRLGGVNASLAARVAMALHPDVADWLSVIPLRRFSPAHRCADERSSRRSRRRAECVRL